jgi:hypothetical protein
MILAQYAILTAVTFRSNGSFWVLRVRGWRSDSDI